jgi:transcription elongation factor Elf1
MAARNYRNTAKSGEAKCWECEHAKVRIPSLRIECRLVGRVVAVCGTCDLAVRYSIENTTEKEGI